MTLKVIGCLLSLILIFPVRATVKAQNIHLSKIIDTVSISQEEYLNEVKASGSETFVDDLNRDSNIIQKTCEGFLAIAKASVRMPAEYNPKVLILDTSLSLDTVEYRLSEYKYQMNLNQLLRQVIRTDSIEFSDFTVTQDANEAKASLVESYKYYINDGFDEENFRRRMYMFDLKQINGKWKISDVVTDDPWERSETFVYQPIDIEMALNEISSKINSVESNTENEIEKKLGNQSIQSLIRWTYTVSDAVDYAVAHYSETSNSVFGFTQDNNCQNFASQCVWAGLGGSGTSTTARPAVPTSLVGTNAFNVWARNQVTTFYPEYYYNWAWDNVNGFAKLMSASTTSAQGPYGNSYYTSALSSVEAGNVISFNQDGTASAGNMDHAMFVTAVTGTAGSRTQANIKIAAHTSPTNSAYQVLSTYTSLPLANFARSAIWSGYYSIQQP